MKSPWKQLQPHDPNREYVAFASRIPPRSRRSTWRLFRGSRAVSRQLAQTDGVVGFSLLARPLRKEYATLSLWIDDASLASFASSAPHCELRDELAPEMAPTTFRRWNVAAGEARPTWSEALRRLAAP
jgi:hypothetical protein